MDSKKNINLVIGIVTVLIVLIMIIGKINEVKKENSPEGIKKERI